MHVLEVIHVHVHGILPRRTQSLTSNENCYRALADTDLEEVVYYYLEQKE